jgi:chaperonin cofactor prefoldin
MGSKDSLAEKVEELDQFKWKDSVIRYSDGEGRVQVASEESAEEVVSDRVEFLENEVRKSEETLMELKQELDDLKGEE